MESEMEGVGDWKKGKLRVCLYEGNRKTDRGLQQGWEKGEKMWKEAEIKDKWLMRCYKSFLID